MMDSWGGGELGAKATTHRQAAASVPVYRKPLPATAVGWANYGDYCSWRLADEATRLIRCRKRVRLTLSLACRFPEPLLRVRRRAR